MKTIMIVDDEILIRSMVRKALENMGYEIMIATDGQAALDKLERHHVDLLITDINMPHISGLELLKRLRSSDKFKDLPVLCITGDSDSHLKEQAKSLGASGWVQKPFTPNGWGPTLSKILD